jgi:hypothetical protein
MLVEYLSRIFGGGKERDASNTTCDFVMFRFELTSWVDGMTREIMDEFCSLLQTTHSDSPLVLIELASAWHSSGLPNPIPNAWLSAVLVRALLRLPRVSESFALLTAQVCIQCMMRDPNPLPLCVIVANASPMETGTIMGRRLKVLGDYARAIVYFDRISGFERHSLLLQLLKTHFASGSYPLAWLLPFPGPEVGRTLQKRDTFALANQTRHMASVLEGNDQVRCRAVLRRLLPLEVAVSGLYARLQ